jgi:hypothetical protein
MPVVLTREFFVATLETSYLDVSVHLAFDGVDRCFSLLDLTVLETKHAATLPVDRHGQDLLTGVQDRAELSHVGAWPDHDLVTYGRREGEHLKEAQCPARERRHATGRTPLQVTFQPTGDTREVRLNGVDGVTALRHGAATGETEEALNMRRIVRRPRVPAPINIEIEAGHYRADPPLGKVSDR